MPTERVWPAVGQKLVHKRTKGSEETVAEVVSVDQERGKISVRVGSQVYPSLSTAARAITGTSTNGWVFWGLKQK